LDSLIKKKSPAFLQDFNSMIYMLFTLSYDSLARSEEPRIKTII
jgi:hypothetical protein